MMVRVATLLLGLLAVALSAYGCGGARTSRDEVTTATGAVDIGPPWRPVYAHLRARMAHSGVPVPGTEKFHHHAQLHVYDRGLSIPIPGKIGIAPGQAAGLHTHDPGGVIHIEASRPFPATLGDFFAIWDVTFSADQLGSLQNRGSDRLHVLANGKPVRDPVGYRIREGDNLVVAFGRAGSFPKKPPTRLLRAEQSGRAGTCGANKKGEKRKSCVAG